MKLEEYFKAINKLGFTMQHFCLIHKIARQSLMKYINGEIPHIHSAKKIVKATKGSVTFKDLGITD